MLGLFSEPAPIKGAGFFVLGARLVRLCLRLGNRCVMCCGWGCRIETMRGMYPSVVMQCADVRDGRKTSAACRVDTDTPPWRLHAGGQARLPDGVCWEGYAGSVEVDLVRLHVDELVYRESREQQ